MPDHAPPASPEPIPKARVWLWIAALLSLALVIRTGIRDRGVITDHLEFGRRLLAGEFLYAPYAGEPALHPPYPPTFGLLTAPFSLMGERLARFAWGILQIGALWTLGILMWRWLQRTAKQWHAPELRPRAPWLLAAAFFLTSRYWLRDTHGGGGNLINTALVLGSCELAWHGRRHLAGVILGASLATKPNLIWFLPVLLLWGQYRTVAIATATGIGASLLSLALLGFELDSWRIWVEGTLAYSGMTDIYGPALHDFPEFEWMNQNLRSAVHRFVGTVPPEQSERMQGWFPGLGLAPATAATLAQLCAGVVLLGTLAVAWRERRGAPGGAPQLAVCGAVLVAALMVSPLSWKAHHVALLPVLFLLLLRGGWRGAGGSPGSRGPWVVAIGFWLTTQVGEALTGKAFKNATQGLYIVTAWDIGLWLCALTWLRRPLRGAGTGPGAGGPIPPDTGNP